MIKDQTNFKSDLGEIKKEIKKNQIKRSNKCNTKCSKFFDLSENVIDLFRNYAFLRYLR